MRKTILFAAVALAGWTSLASAEEFTVEVSKPLPRGRGLGTMAYRPTEKEKVFIERVTEKPLNPWAMGGGADKKDAKRYRLEDQAGQYARWFGIVRGITHDDKKGTTRLLLEHKYFDGLTDLHIQIVSIYGAGDFAAILPKKVDSIPMLSLVCVYGKVSKDKDKGGIATVAAEYVRLWDWGLFSFMDYGKDYTNPQWLKLRKVTGSAVYSPSPDRKFYEDRLGKRDSD